ncbi:MAG: HEAT repeat domain-containing protein [Cyclobacteriaceae bacterium]
MIDRVLNSLNVRAEERTQVLLMLSAGFFMGVFVATFQNTADSLFLNRMSQHLDKAFLASGLLGIIATGAFSFFQSRVKFINLAIIGISLIVAQVSAFYLLFEFGNPAWQPYLLFYVYILTGPSNVILLLIYWGVFGRLFNFKQSKRIIGWIDTGQLIAIIISFFLIPLTASLIPDTQDYLIVSNLSIVASLVCMIVIARKYTLIKNDPREEDASVRAETKLRKILRNRYVLLLSLFLVTSMVTFILSQYSFQNLLNQQFTSARELTDFLAYFYGTTYALSLFMQLFVNDRLLSIYGIRTSLLMLPIIVGIVAVGAVVMGLIYGFSVAGAGGSFAFFFVMVAVMRLFNGTLRESLESPIFKLLFVPIDARHRFNIQTKVEGSISETGRFMAGLMIFAFSLIPAFKIIWIPAIVAGVAVVYIFLTTRLYAGYRNKIREKLEEREGEQQKLDLGQGQVIAKLERLVMDEQGDRAIFSFKLLEKLEPGRVSGWISSLVKHQYDEVREFAQHRLNELKGLSVSESYVIKTDVQHATDGRKTMSRAELISFLDSGGDVTRARLRNLSRSTNPRDRQYAAELLLHAATEENLSFLIELLGDPEPIVRRTAIQTAMKRYDNEVLNALIENFGHPSFSAPAMDTLVVIGDNAVPVLESAFYRSGQSTTTIIRIVQVMGRIGSQRAKDLLWNKIDYPDKVVVSQVLLALGNAGFKAGISQITRIKYAIESDIGDIAWNLNAIQSLENTEFAELERALKWEVQNDTQHMYMLLAMLYDTRSIQLVKENIDSGTAEGTAFAVELLDVFLSEQLKQRVIPVLDDLSNGEKVNRLDVFYPRVPLDDQLALKFILNRDFSQANRWTKACVLQRIGELKLIAFKLDLIAQLFNQDVLIRQQAAWALHEIDGTEYRENRSRLPYEVARRLDEVILSGDTRRKRLYEEIVFLEGLPAFTDIPGINLSYVAEMGAQVSLEPGNTLALDDKANQFFYLVMGGVLQVYRQGRYVKDIAEGAFVGEALSIAGTHRAHLLVAKERADLLQLDKERFYELLAGNMKLADQFLEYI